jgi:hypothetical protein
MNAYLISPVLLVVALLDARLMRLAYAARAPDTGASELNR